MYVTIQLFYKIMKTPEEPSQLKETNENNETNQKKFSNWLQSVQSLEETKHALHDHVLVGWKNEFMSWKKEVRAEIPTFIDCVAKDEIAHSKKKWECRCKHKHCSSILGHLLRLQQNPGFNIIWNSKLCEIVSSGEELSRDDVGDENMLETIPRVETTRWRLFLRRFFRPFQYLARRQGRPGETVNFEDISEGFKKKHIWCIANMYMQRGKAKMNISNTGPEDTDASMFFQMMKNCKLFEIVNENYLYDDVLLCRHRLHHSASNRITRKEADACFDKMIDFLKTFENVPKCKDAIASIEKMRKETILCIAMPDVVIREMAKKVLKLKKTALEVDKEADRDKGFSNDETESLLEDTISELEKIEDPIKPMNETKSRQDYMRETEEIKQHVTELERENFRLNEINKSRNGGYKVKNPKKHFEVITNLLQTYSHNEKIAVGIETLIPLLDEIVKDASHSDEELTKKAKEAYEETTEVDIYQKTEYNPEENSNGHEEVDRDKPSKTGTDVYRESAGSGDLQRKSIETEAGMRKPHVWSMASTYSYRIDAAGENGCDIQGCCLLLSGDILLVDFLNKRLKKFDVRHQIISICDVPGGPRDVCSLCNNEAVVSQLQPGLMFVDVKTMTMTRSLSTEHVCRAMTCHGNKLYVTDAKTVYLYSTTGIKQCDLYTVSYSSSCLITGIAVSDCGSKVYITFKDKLITIDSLGNHLYTFNDPELYHAGAVCLDSVGHILVCDCESTSIIQISSDGKHKLGTIANISSKFMEYTGICFDRHNTSILICTSDSGELTVSKLK